MRDSSSWKPPAFDHNIVIRYWQTPRTSVVFYRELGGEAPVLEWLVKLRRKDQRAYASCVAALERLAAFGHELRRPLTDLLRDGIHELRIRKEKSTIESFTFSTGKA